MDLKTKTNRLSRKQDHPYKALEGSPTWERVDLAISALVKNGDLKETTRREYVVGYICKVLMADQERQPRRTVRKAVT